MDPFKISYPAESQVPIVLSIPHCGTAFPTELRNQYTPHLASCPDDTDWFVDVLYDFAPSFGIPVLSAVYSRWVVDLNRDPSDVPLYSDGRVITGLCPVRSFKGELLYKDARTEVEADEIARRKELYYYPYHNILQRLIEESLERFGKVLLWDCHSIRQYVPAIHDKAFPDLILGDNDGFSAGHFLTEMASKSLHSSGYTFENNFLFKGGYITRHYGQPELNRHALQLEMTKRNYMDDSESSYHPARAAKMREQLKRMFEKLIILLNF